ncbi:SH3 and cysteine-rich domain-containing protein isoform X2 [Physeter macrocephalus]|uniref:SH3 and cysteine-rich domain-containing protein n=1 Tax=Physeter macrocephalus TaxID=9755 RepID=A0A2Y9F6P0_PHYMC|nr:SH3 and cysteine-rich domain-containing protein isoform X2 [Physeter catodon]|eukprot:XP_007115234.1 SH3 and cysteine-rich domain-containing protein isoform X2 [Physeter catodon]
MIPPSGAREDGVDGLPKETTNAEQPPSPASTGSQESKTKSLRSKSADNFFQRTNSDVKLQADMLSEVSPSSSLLPAPGCLTSTVTRAGLYPGGGKAHAFQEHIFKKPTFCDVCNHMIVGTNAKHGLRCKACKMSVHHKCMDGLAPQRCVGKLPKGFRRYYSSPLLIHEQFGCIKEVMPIACGNKVDPVYETLRFGTSLAQRTKKGSSGSGSNSPHGTSISDLVEVPEEADGPAGMYGLRKRSNSVFTYPENGTDDFRDQAKNINHQGHLSKDQLQMNTYVALYKFTPQENEDLEMRPGDMITLLEDSNEDWWKGKIQDRIGFFPANFVQRVQQNEKIFKCVRTFIGCKEQGQITLKENQICVTSEEEQDGFIRVLSGKKRGLVPFDVLENI